MTNIQAFILGVVQAITEFLPVSSSGHLVLFQKIFNLETPPIFFDVLVHIGTLLAIIFYLRKEIISLILNLKENRKLIFFLFLGSLPIALVGLSLKDYVENIFNSLAMVGISFLITSFILLSTLLVKNSQKNISNMTWKDSLFVGLFQALAFLPGVSRSGSTISAGLFRKMDKESAFKFSFLLAIPAFAGALALQLFDIEKVNLTFSAGLIGFLTSLFFGFFALRLLERALLKGKIHLFGIYCFLLGLVIIFVVH